ncbi:phospho-sugar mutase [Helicobacter sp. 13S00401-1]|uniref:phosphomannomutase/phosphoglucomutase n=1 Tax=Helicobacter sp. 13S00401-1 TaxID=1905758 RepID=UPI000BA7D574|nr:phosphomannomutase/phosphoglucomutase [Helicobacter sp. 13S00401-1]PAF51670.1 phospho-sugar mutase [Helicobacter sp. 13S00401-1]
MIFREYDIRGIVDLELNAEIVFKIGYLLAERIKTTRAGDSVYIGYDARTHSSKLFGFLTSGFNANGIKVYDLGMIPTPVAYFATFQSEIKNSVMITGSHNPPEYNGFKITIDQKPFYGKEIQDLKQKMPTLKHLDIKKELATKVQTFKSNMLESYIKYLTHEFSDLKNFKSKVAIDCGNGVASIALKPILEALNIKASELYFTPDGTFPNHHPDPSVESNLQNLKDLMHKHDISIGIAFDGDADRIALISKDYVFKGDELAILFGRDIAKSVKNPIIIGEVKCSSNMYKELDKIGTSYMYKTGHSNLKVKLKELNAALACEMSGHIFFNDRYFGFDDAIYACFRILELIKKDSIEGLQKDIESLPKLFSTDEEKIAVDEEEKFVLIDTLKKRLSANLPANFPYIEKVIDIDGVRVVFEHGFGLVRASNTTPVLVTRFEATSEALLKEYKTSLLNLVSELRS